MVEDAEKRARTERVIKRVIVCVDGTWFDPDGLEADSQKSLTNVFRIYSATKDGHVENDNVLQVKKYWPGPGTEANLVTKTAAGIWGTGCEDIIKDVYKFCCDEATSSTDEIYMFGFSRGAYIIRAVAGLLYNMHAIKTENNTFDADYSRGLQIYADLTDGITSNSPGACYNFLNSKTREPPVVKFVGCFDTVKAVRLSSLHHDISVNRNVHRYRQALAMNEERTVFKHELLTPKRNIESMDISGDTSGHYQDAWFLGAHADLGGGNKHDGLSLYPLQWVLSEAVACGLILAPELRLQERNLVPDLATMLFPQGSYELFDVLSDPKIRTIPYLKGPFVAPNGITLHMWDIRSVHSQSQYRPMFNSSVILFAGFTYELKPRRIFERNLLVGYHRDSPNGTLIHPSAYMLHDTCTNFRDGQASWGFYEDFEKVRSTFVRSDLDFWGDEADMIPESLEKIRILVCGNNGIGKSTIINRVFGIASTEDGVTKVTHNEHGQHDIYKELTHPNRPQFIIHDSRGFQVGLNAANDKDQNEVKNVHKFIQERLQNPDINQRLHVIWYCVDINKTRPTELADQQLISSVQSIGSHVPLVLVLTMQDKLWDQIRSSKMSELEEESEDAEADFIAIRRLANSTADSAVNDRKALFEREFKKISKQPLIGPVLTSDKPKYKESFRDLVRLTTSNLDNQRVMKMFVAAQLCDVETKVSSAITEAMGLFKAATRTSAVPIPIVGVAAQVTCGSLIVKRMLIVFGYDYLNSDIVWQAVKDACFHNLGAVAVNMGAIVLGISAALKFSPALPVALLIDGAIAVTAIPRTARMILMFAADIILILERAFWYHTNDGHNDGLINDEDIRRAAIQHKKHIDAVHTRIIDAVPIHSFYQILKSPSSSEKLLKSVLQEFRFKQKGKGEGL